MSSGSDHEGARTGGTLFWVAASVGWSVMAYGVYGVIRDAAATRPSSFAAWFVGSALVHDLLIAPAVLAAGAAIVRWVPARDRSMIQATLLISGAAALFAIPFVLRLGGAPGNPSALPRDYGAGLALILVVVWGAAFVGLLVRRTLPRPRSGGKKRFAGRA
ncbi:MAG: hypothetical protein ACRDJ4_11365 [Actinomycetota bacterium]